MAQRSDKQGDRRLIIHCGVQKTASTAFHHFVHRNWDALSDYLDMFMPEAKSPTRKLGRTSALYTLGENSEAELVAVIQRLRKDLSQGKRTMLVSHENLPGAMLGRSGVTTLYPEIERILTLLGQHFSPYQPEYVFYTRAMKDWKKSVYNQAVKSDKYNKSRDEFLTETHDCGSWDELRTRVSAVVGAERVRFFALEEEVDPSKPGQQLLKFAGVPEAVLATLHPVSGRRNQSLNAGALEFTRRLNELNLPRNARRSVVKMIQQGQSLFVSDEGLT